MVKEIKGRVDGWKNLLTGLGKKRTDKSKNTFFNRSIPLEDEELSALYDDEGLATKVVDLMTDDMTRPGWKINDDSGKEDLEVKKILQELRAQSVINKAHKYARLYGGAIVLMVFERGGNLKDPLPANPGKITKLRVYSAARIEINQTDVITDSNSPFYDDVEVYPVTLKSGETDYFHTTRCLIFKGEASADSTQGVKFKTTYWGKSVIQRVWTRLANFSTTEAGVANLMQEFSVGKYKLHGLAKILSSNDPGAVEKVYTRMEIIQASKSINNAVLLGENDDYIRDTVNVTGVADIIDRMQQSLAAVSGYPVTKLFRRSPGGQNATGESDLVNYYDSVESKKDTELLPGLTKLVEWVVKSLKRDPAKYSIIFNPSWEPTAKEKAEIDQMNSETYANYLDRQVVDAEFVAGKVFPEYIEG